MPHQIEIDDDIYAFLESNARGFGQTPSSALRPYLPLSGKHRPITATKDQITPSVRSVQSLISPPPFIAKRATDKYLILLEFAHDRDPERFKRVLKVSGRKRQYFGRTRDEIEASGTSTHPRPIGKTGYWAMTNADTLQKREMLRGALSVLDFSAEEIDLAQKAIF